MKDGRFAYGLEGIDEFLQNYHQEYKWNEIGYRMRVQEAVAEAELTSVYAGSIPDCCANCEHVMSTEAEDYSIALSCSNNYLLEISVFSVCKHHK